MKNTKEIIRVGLILFAITAIAAFLLAFANKITAPLIEINNKLKTEESMKVVMENAETFVPCDYAGDEVNEVYFAKDSSGALIGLCVVSAENGYGGAVNVMIGIGLDGKVTGIDIISHSETPNLGSNADKDEFKNQYIGKTSGITAVKGNAEDNEISAMSGATVTSKAVTAAVNNALSVAEKIMREA